MSVMKMETVLCLKFTQHEELLKELLSTGSNDLVYVSRAYSFYVNEDTQLNFSRTHRKTIFGVQALGEPGEMSWERHL
jgi:hypothetical protein